MFSIGSQGKEKYAEYKVIVKTGEYSWAGTNSLVQLTVIGDSGVTKLHELDTWRDDHEKGDTCQFSFEDINVGNIEYVSLYLDKTAGIQDFWYVDHIIVRKIDKNGKTSETFPVFSWITENHEKIVPICSNKTLIPQKETIMREVARTQVTNKDTLSWHHSLKGFFGFAANPKKEELTYHSLDWNLKYHDDQDRNFYGRLDESIKNMKLQHFMSLFKSFDDLKDFSKASGTLESVCYPWMYKDIWKTDVEFGRQILNGANPFVIKKCESLPKKFPVTNLMVKGLMSRRLTLEEEMEKGNVFIVDYDILQGISTGTYKEKKINLPSPICLFYVKLNPDKTEDLVPIAIQLGQTPGNTCPIWTPNDKPLDWLLAKMWFKNADLIIQHVTINTCGIHMFLEPFAIAMHRCLPHSHPVHKLLKEHLQFVIGTNTVARETLICKVIVQYGAQSKSLKHIIHEFISTFYFLILIL